MATVMYGSKFYRYIPRHESDRFYFILMNTQVGFILKVVILSAILSFVIKDEGKLIPLTPTNLNAIIVVLLPTLILSLILGWRWQQQEQTK